MCSGSDAMYSWRHYTRRPRLAGQHVAAVGRRPDCGTAGGEARPTAVRHRRALHRPAADRRGLLSAYGGHRSRRERRSAGRSRPPDHGSAGRDATPPSHDRGAWAGAAALNGSRPRGPLRRWRFPTTSEPEPVVNRSFMSPNGPNPAQVMPLESLPDFLMHGVVLQNRVFPPVRAMFHVKHFCVKAILRAASQVVAGRKSQLCRRRVRPPTAPQRVGTGVPVL